MKKLRQTIGRVPPAYALCSIAAFAAVWAHRFPGGVDLPQHGNLFEILGRYLDPTSGYRFFYSIDPFTPYAAVYLLAWPFAFAFGGLFATKVMLTFAVLGTPFTMTRWLRAAGGEPTLGLLGFLVAFGFGYQWGFLSFVLATPVAFAYLEAFEKMRKERTLRRLAAAALLAVCLFFVHGLAFLMTLAATGIACVLQRGFRRILFDLCHFLPAAAVFLPWYFGHHDDAAGKLSDWPTSSRIVTLFAGAFAPSADYYAALAGMALVFLIVLFARPILQPIPSRLLPAAVALVGLFSVPEWVGSTYLVGTRFVHFVHAYVPGAWNFALDDAGRVRMRRALTSIVLFALAVQNVRLWGFNQELSGLERLRAYVPPGSDVRLSPDHSNSEWMGDAQLAQVGAWITAQQRGFLENDHARYFQLPLQRRRDLPWPSEYEYVIARGSERLARSSVGQLDLIRHTGEFSLFRAPRTPLTLAGFDVIRFAQAWGKPQQDHSVTHGALSVANRTFEHGIGSHAASIIQIRAKAGTRRLLGSVGLDAGAADTSLCAFMVMDGRRRTLWRSPAMNKSRAAVPFDVSVEDARGDLFLVVETLSPNNGGAHADWLDVGGEPARRDAAAATNP